MDRAFKVFFKLTLGCMAGILNSCAQTFIPTPWDSGHTQQDELIYAPVLGVGVNFAESQTFNHCIEGTRILPTTGGFSYRLYEESRVQTHEELDKLLGVHASVRAKGLWGRLNAESSPFNNVTLYQDALFWLIKAHYDLSTEVIDPTYGSGFGLTSRALEVLQNGGIESFYKTCGTHFYIGRKLGARYDILYEFQFSDEKSKGHVEASIESKFSFGLQASAEFKNFLHAAKNSSVMVVHSEIRGGGSGIKDYAKMNASEEDPGNLENILSALRSDLESGHKGEVLEWLMQSYDIFPEVQKAQEQAKYQELADDLRNEALDFYYRLYKRNMEELAHIHLIVERSFSSEPYYVYSKDHIEAMKAYMTSLRQQNQNIKQRAEGCLKGSNTCDTTGLDMLTFRVPDPDEDYSGLKNWDILGIFYKSSVVDLYAEPYDPKAMSRIFRTRGVLLEINGKATARVKNKDGTSSEVVIGTYEQVTEAGQPRINICIGDYAEICSFRMLQDKKHPMIDDGSPTPKLNLTVYDTYGFVRSNHYFLADSPKKPLPHSLTHRQIL